ncbi:hypothetical protein Leryth_027312 [Lithospermum erythrorhizon]|uniref:HMG box domain-containing protein n=1 Tax=Lithospermum erythrorhizon TaxID=34254 RepID=A0AAV3R5I7_LITER|nr:hypothetical protein Leryth_027312 [Lithospermum erythrorhizon]
MKGINVANVAHKKLDTQTIRKPKAEPKKKKPNKKVSGAPKRPISAFLVFMEDFRKTYKENFPDNKSLTSVTKAGGQKWSSLSESEKLPYLNIAAKKKQEYEKAVEEFNKENLSGNSGGGKTEESEKSSSCEVNDDAEQEASS